MNLFELFVKIGVDDQASGKISNIADKLGKGLVTASKIGVAAIGAITAATTAMSVAFIKGASAVAAYGDDLDEMAQKMGMSTKAFQEWDFIMQRNGTSMETLKASMKTLATAADTGSEAFERLGISQAEIASMSQEELFAATITALQGVGNETERTYLAGQLLGRGATELGPILNMTADDMESLRQEVHLLGGVMSEEAIQAASAYQDSMHSMQTAFEGLKRNLFDDFLPSMSTVMDGIAKIFSGQDGGTELLERGIDDFIDELENVIPKIIEIVKDIGSALIRTFLNKLPDMISAGVNFIGKLSEGMVDGIPKVVSATADITNSIVDTIFDMDWGAVGGNILKAVWNGIIALIPELTSLLTDLMEGIIEFFLPLFSPIATGFADTPTQLAWEDAFMKALRDKNDADLGKFEKLVSSNLMFSATPVFSSQGKGNSWASSLQDAADTLWNTFFKGRESNKNVSVTGISTSDAEEQVDEQMKLQEEFVNFLESATDKMIDIEEDYQEALRDRIDLIKQSYGIFDEAVQREQVSSTQLVVNLRSNNRALERFYANIEKLKERGAPEELVEELIAGGLDVANEVQALVTAAPKVFEGFVDAYTRKNEMAEKYATQQLEPMKEETESMLNSMFQTILTTFDANAEELGTSFIQTFVETIKNGGAALTSALNDFISDAMINIEGAPLLKMGESGGGLLSMLLGGAASASGGELAIYLDGDKLVGGISDRMNTSLGDNYTLDERGAMG